jgi:hypothetical protein
LQCCQAGEREKERRNRRERERGIEIEETEKTEIERDTSWTVVCETDSGFIKARKCTW